MSGGWVWGRSWTLGPTASTRSTRRAATRLGDSICWSTLFADYMEEVVRTHVPHELELSLEVVDRLRESVVRAQVFLEGTVLRFQLDHGGGVVDGGLDLATVPDDPGVGGQPIDLAR